MTPQKSEADYRLARFADTTQEDLFFCFFLFFQSQGSLTPLCMLVSLRKTGVTSLEHGSKIQPLQVSQHILTPVGKRPKVKLAT